MLIDISSYRWPPRCFLHGKSLNDTHLLYKFFHIHIFNKSLKVIILKNKIIKLIFTIGNVNVTQSLFLMLLFEWPDSIS